MKIQRYVESLRIKIITCWKKKNLKKSLLISICFLTLCVTAIFIVPALLYQENIDASTEQTYTQSQVTEMTKEPTIKPDNTEQTTVEETVPEETKPNMLEGFVELYEKNPDLAGWIRIANTVIDYPVMFTPEDAEKYIYKNFEGEYDDNGLLFVDGNCSMEPESDNLIIYGHNMRSGAMFASLLYYASKSYWQAHPIIEFSTLYETRKYEIVAAFYDRVYNKSDTCFKFYQFVNVDSKEAFQEGMSYFKEKACYETGVTAEYGDSLITLVTCAYHVKNGRFVVVAREVI